MLPRNMPGTIEGEMQGVKYATFMNVVIVILVFIAIVIALILIGIGSSILDDYQLSGTKCEDGNTCTYDLERSKGGCIYVPKPPGHSCTSECYRSTPDLGCVNLQLTKGVLTPKCVSPTLSACRGTCEVDGDCVDLPTQAGGVTGECKENTCYYVRDQTGDGDYDSSEIPDLDCTPEAEAFQNYCSAYLNTSDPIVQQACISFSVQCESAPLDGGGTTSIPVCYYYFWCSVQAYVPVPAKKKRAVEPAVQRIAVDEAALPRRLALKDGTSSAGPAFSRKRRPAPSRTPATHGAIKPGTRVAPRPK